MRVLIVEDEKPAAQALQRLISQYDPNIEVMDVLDSVDSTVKWLNNLHKPDLVFLDIQLADGLSFDIFMKTELTAPVIFTTAYDQYTLKAFKVNSVDYLLKPIDPAELNGALDKFRNLQERKSTYDRAVIDEIIAGMTNQPFRSRLLVKTGQQFMYVETQDVLFAFSAEGMNFVVTRDGRKHLIDKKMEELETSLNPDQFQRVNRTYLVHVGAIKKIHTWFNSRLKLELTHGDDHEIIVSRERVPLFKDWLDR